MFAFTDLLVVCLGAAVGSFINVVVLRTQAQQSWLVGHSHCPHCGATLRWFELVPVVSYLIQRGQCRRCRGRLAVQYILVEAVTALAFMLVFRAFGPNWTTVIGWLVTASMIAIAVYDWRWSLVPDEFSFTLIATAILTSWLMENLLIDIILGAVFGFCFFGLQYALSRGRWVGSAELLLGLGLGILLGWKWLGLALLVAYMIGALGAAILIATRRAKRSSLIPFAPILMLGGFIAWLWGPNVVQWYLRYALGW